jgi:2-aminoadipate transaminase
MAAKYRLSEKARRTSDPPITWLVRQAVSNPGVISLAAGLVDQQTLPTEDVRQILGELLANPIAGRAALQYGTADGHDVLRKRLLDRFCRAENVEPGTLALSADDVIVTTGCQQLLMLLADVLLDPGDIVFVGDPAYFVFMSLLQSVDARPRGVPLDGDGMRIDALEAGLEAAERAGELDRVKAVYVASYYENPTGLSLNAARRRQLFDLVGRYSIERQILIIEDAAYRELRYEGDDVPSIKSLDARNEVVVHCGTFSKPFSPGLRTGWGIVPPEVMTALRRQKANHDFGSANLPPPSSASGSTGTSPGSARATVASAT